MTSSRQQLDGVGKLRRYANRRAAAGGAPVTVALIVLVLALGSNASASTNRSATTNAPAAVTPSPGAVVTISPLEHGRPVPAGFVGLSLEYRSLLSYLGTDPSTINPVFVRLLRALTPGQAPVLRIGGDSTDWTWWPVPHMRRPKGITYNLTPDWLAVARALAHRTGARYILGVNLEAGNLAIETAEAHALLSGLGRRSVAALELGNEPELYSKMGWYRSGDLYVPGRPANYDFRGFTDEFSEFRKAIPSVPLAGPSTGSYWWLAHLPQFLDAEPSLGVVTVHSYWLNRCLSSPGLPGYPTIPHLLAPFPPSRLAGALPQYAALGHSHGVPIRIDEMNSVTCGGQHGVSDVFASALWALNALFEAMSDGVDGVNIHTFPGTANQLFSFTRVNGQWVATVRPEYYGLVLFAQAAPPGAAALKIVQQSTGQIRCWATMGSDRTTRVVLINDSLTQSNSVLVRVPTPGAPAELERLLAPSAYATSGITIGGQSFGPTGGLTGPTSTSTLQPSSSTGGIASYVVTVPAASAAMLTIAPQPQPQPQAAARR